MKTKSQQKVKRISVKSEQVGKSIDWPQKETQKPGKNEQAKDSEVKLASQPQDETYFVETPGETPKGDSPESEIREEHKDAKIEPVQIRKDRKEGKQSKEIEWLKSLIKQQQKTLNQQQKQIKKLTEDLQPKVFTKQ